MIKTTLHPTTITTHERVYEDHLRRIYRKGTDFEEFSKQYLIADTGVCAAVRVTCEAYILIVRLYGLLIKDIGLEIPGGKLDDGETPEKMAIHECCKETGVECKNLKYLHNYFLNLDLTYNPTYNFYSSDPIQTSIKRTERSLWLPLDICLDVIITDKIHDAITIFALLTGSIHIGSEGKKKEEAIKPFMHIQECILSL